MVHMTEDEIRAYREQRAADKAKAEEETRKTQAQKDKEQAKARRSELETSLRARFLASGGTDLEWLAVKRRVVEDALIRQTLAPDEPEPEPKKIPAPLPRSRYRD